MKKIKLLILGIAISTCVASCTHQKIDSDVIEVSGILRVQGITTYQYGTHTISNYAVRSRRLNLDSFVDQNITIIGRKIDGYPVDGGPDYLEVEEIK